VFIQIVHICVLKNTKIWRKNVFRTWNRTSSYPIWNLKTRERKQDVRKAVDSAKKVPEVLETEPKMKFSF